MVVVIACVRFVKIRKGEKQSVGNCYQSFWISYVNGSEGGGGDEGWGKAIKCFWEFHFHVHGAGSDQRSRSTYKSAHVIISKIESNGFVQGVAMKAGEKVATKAFAPKK